MLVSGGYPEAYEKGKKIVGFDNIQDALVFHAGAKYDNEDVVTSGGRVMAVTAFGSDYKKALEQTYNEVSKITFEGMNYRKDLGFDL
jgi:phosphoribosylamine--glycine ligase